MEGVTHFSYIKKAYGVPAELYRQVIVDGKKGVITKDMGNYIGVNFYDNITYCSLPCHPTWHVEYLETFDHNPPILKLSRSKKRYMEYKKLDIDISFAQFLGIKK